MKKMKKGYILVCMLTLMCSGCDIPGVTEPFNGGVVQRVPQNESESGKEEIVKRNEITDTVDLNLYTLRYIPEGKEIFQIGEDVEPLGVIADKACNYVRMKVTGAKVYEHLSDAPIDNLKISDEWELFDGVCAYEVKAYKDDVSMKAKFLLCDMELEYTQKYLDWIDFDNITKYSLIYVQDDGSYVMTGFPMYLSSRDTSRPVYKQNEFDVESGINQLQVGWIIDAELFDVETFDVSKLYICTAHDGDEKFQEFIYLGLEN